MSQQYLTLKQNEESRDTPDRLQSELLILWMNVDQKSFETSDKWQSKALFLVIFYPQSSIVKIVFDCRLSGVRECELRSGGGEETLCCVLEQKKSYT